MTEQTTPPQQQTTEQLKLEIINEIAHIAGDPTETLARVGDHLNHLYAAMQGDGQDTTLLAEVWRDANALVAQQSSIMDVTIRARALAAELKDKLVDAETQARIQESQHDKLTKAIIDHDPSHPLVEAMMDDIRDEVVEDYWESGFFVSYCPACEMGDAGLAVEHDVAMEFHQYLFALDDVSADEQTELEDFIKQFVTKVRARHELQREERRS